MHTSSHHPSHNRGATAIPASQNCDSPDPAFPPIRLIYVRSVKLNKDTCAVVKKSRGYLASAVFVQLARHRATAMNTDKAQKDSFSRERRLNGSQHHPRRKRLELRGIEREERGKLRRGNSVALFFNTAFAHFLTRWLRTFSTLLCLPSFTPLCSPTMSPY